MKSNPPTPIRRPFVNFVALLAAVLLALAAVVAGIAGHDEPAARFVVLECQGFEALASAGSERVRCDAAPEAAVNAAPDAAGSDVKPVDAPAPALGSLHSRA
jgi:hypothetical protein